MQKSLKIKFLGNERRALEEEICASISGGNKDTCVDSKVCDQEGCYLIPGEMNI